MYSKQACHQLAFPPCRYTIYDTYTHANTHKNAEHILTFILPSAASVRCVFVQWAVMPCSSAPCYGFKRDTQMEPMATMHVPYPSAGADLK